MSVVSKIITRTCCSAAHSRHEYLQIVESVVESVVVEEVVIISRLDSIQANAARSINQSKKGKGRK